MRRIQPLTLESRKLARHKYYPFFVDKDTGEFARLPSSHNVFRTIGNDLSKSFPHATAQQIHCAVITRSDEIYRKSVVASYFECKRKESIIMCMIMFASALYIGSVLTVLGNEDYKRSYGHEKIPPLPDNLTNLIINVIGSHNWHLYIAEVIIIFQTILMVFKSFETHKLAVNLKRMLVQSSALVLIKAVVMYSLILPKPNPDLNCHSQVIDGLWELLKSSFFHSLFLGLNVVSHDDMCGQAIMSGHAIFAIITALHILKDSQNRMFKTAIRCSTLLCLTFIISSRSHYTIGVIVGVFGTYSVFKYYHSALSDIRTDCDLNGINGFVYVMERNTLWQ